jgi:hypothetical protein
MTNCDAAAGKATLDEALRAHGISAAAIRPIPSSPEDVKVTKIGELTSGDFLPPSSCCCC